MRVLCPPVGGSGKMIEFKTHPNKSRISRIGRFMMGPWPEGLLREEASSVILAVTVKPASKRNRVEAIDVWRGRLQVAIRKPPVKGEANEKVIALLAEKFSIASENIEIITGHRSRQKSVRLVQTKLSKIEPILEELLADKS